MATEIMALDVRKSAVHLVRMHTTLRQAQLTAAQTYPLPDPESLPQVLAQILADHGQAQQVVVSAPQGRTAPRLLTFPFTDPRKVEQVIDFELESQVPQDFDALARTWNVVDRGSAETRVLALTCPRDDVVARIELMADPELNLDPRAIVPPAVGLTAFAEEGTAISASVYVGESMSEVLVVRGGAPLMVRTIRHGAVDIDRAIRKAFAVDLDKARLARQQEASLEDAPMHQRNDSEALAHHTQLRQAVETGLGGLVRSLAATFKALPTDLAPRSIHITGTLQHVPGLCPFLSQKIGVAVSPLNLASGLQGIDAEAEADDSQAVALGLALALYRRGRQLPLNLRQGDLAYSTDLNLYRGEVVRLAVGLAAVFVLALVGMGVRLGSLNAQERDLTEGFCKATQKIVGQRICDVERAMAVLREAPSEGGISIPEYSAAQIFEMMSKGIGPAVDLSFSQLDLRLNSSGGDPDRVSGKGEAADFDTIDKAVAVLENAGCVKKVEISRRRKTRNSGRVEFNIAMEVDCAAGEQPGANLPDVAEPVTPSIVADETPESGKAGSGTATTPSAAAPGLHKEPGEATAVNNPPSTDAKSRLHERRETRRKMLQDLRQRGASSAAEEVAEELLKGRIDKLRRPASTKHPIGEVPGLPRVPPRVRNPAQKSESK